MIKRNLDSDTKKSLSATEIEDGFILCTAASGDLPNDKVPNCYTCKKHGHPHEAITFEKVNGRLRNDGTYEAKYWKLRDYFTGRPHQHKHKGGSNRCNAAFSSD